jgi:ABC-type transport system involved in Fe-S cluster assembly fused permease/ATPase subunit
VDPLAQLQDIQLPEKIHNYPFALGWWIIAVICIALVIFIIFKIINYKKARQVQQQAITQISSNSSMDIAECVAVLKWAALQYFPRERIANLYGESLHSFLLETLPENTHEKFKTLSNDSLQTMYQKDLSDTDNINFQQASAYWLKHALPPKSNSVANQTLTESKL